MLPTTPYRTTKQEPNVGLEPTTSCSVGRRATIAPVRPGKEDAPHPRIERGSPIPLVEILPFPEKVVSLATSLPRRSVSCFAKQTEKMGIKPLDQWGEERKASSRRGSNPGPSACEADDLPTELREPPEPLPGIEPGSAPPEGAMLPLYHRSPKKRQKETSAGFEPAPPKGTDFESVTLTTPSRRPTWRLGASIPLPVECESTALPLELNPPKQKQKASSPGIEPGSQR